MKHTVKKILKVTSVSTPEIVERVDKQYKSIITASAFLVSSIKVVEASKVIEKIRRGHGITLINKLALIFDQAGINIKDNYPTHAGLEICVALTKTFTARLGVLILLITALITYNIALQLLSYHVN